MDDFRHYLTIVQFTSPPVSSSSWHLGKLRGNWRRNQIEFTVKSESFRYLDLPPEIIFKFLVLTNCIDWPGMHYRSFWSRDVIDVLCIVATHTPVKHFRARVTPEQIHLFVRLAVVSGTQVGYLCKPDLYWNMCLPFHIQSRTRNLYARQQPVRFLPIICVGAYLSMYRFIVGE